MTVKELASKLNELFRDGKGDLFVYFESGDEISHPILTVEEDDIESLNMPIIILSSQKEN